MSWLLRLPIWLYWIAWPEGRRRQCLFAESCSRHVYRVASSHGLGAGLRALLLRVRRCRPGWTILPSDDGRSLRVRLADGTVVDEHDLARATLEPFRSAVRALERQLGAM